MAAETIASSGVQTLGRYAHYACGVELKSPSSLVHFPVNANHFGGLRTVKPSIVYPPLKNNRVSNGVASGSQGMTRWHEIELAVREYEVDQYGVVNNSVYSNYCQLAHYALLTRMGIPTYSLDSIVVLALTDLSLKFISPLKSGDRFLLKVRISNVTRVRVSFQHSITKIPNQQPIMEANATAVCLDKSNHQVVRVPPELRSTFDRFISETETDQGRHW